MGIILTVFIAETTEGRKKKPKAKDHTNSTKEFSEQFEGTTQQNKGFKANRTRKYTQKFFAQVLWGTLSVPEKIAVR